MLWRTIFIRHDNSLKSFIRYVIIIADSSDTVNLATEPTGDSGGASPHNRNCFLLGGLKSCLRYVIIITDNSDTVNLATGPTGDSGKAKST